MHKKTSMIFKAVHMTSNTTRTVSTLNPVRRD